MIARIDLGLFTLGSRSPLLDPRPDRGNLGGLQRSSLERHAFVHVVGCEPGEETTLIRLAGDDDWSIVACGAKQFRGIEAQARFCLEDTVAGITPRLQDRLDLARIIHGESPGRTDPCGDEAERGGKMSLWKMHRDFGRPSALTYI